ncbi:MAG: Uma2 family endonuclease [Leptolyngbyaceae cyanobacterium SM1_3_5]|nr:Uma2 family endonuclease [Leptolyngbyaceae cyanobacterium SM1_3_5]
MVKPFFTVPPLENGDRLTRSEFECRYAAMPHVKKAELIEGKVYVASPVRIVNHGRPHAQMIFWLGVYCAATPGVDIADNATVRLDADNEPQPDCLLRIEPEFGGTSRISADGYVEGAPELIVEVAASSAAYDMDEKLRVYRRNGVQEYLVWQVDDDRLDWFSLQSGRYTNLEPEADGIIRSRIFPGLWLDIDGLLNGNLAELLATVQSGVSTAEHQIFADRFTQK